MSKICELEEQALNALEAKIDYPKIKGKGRFLPSYAEAGLRHHHLSGGRHQLAAVPIEAEDAPCVL